jgi:signal transduction histidine kinase
MARMIAQLLDFTRARLGPGIPLNPQPCDLREVCANVVGEIDAEHPNRLHLEAEGELTGQWDSDRLAQMFSNLFANAVDHGSQADPVRIRLCREDGAVRVQVSNRGEPIPAPLQATIFEPFRRGSRERTGQSRGLGLGLYITREIVRSHGGTIDLQSGPEETVFTVKLPVTQQRSEAAPLPRRT